MIREDAPPATMQFMQIYANHEPLLSSAFSKSFTGRIKVYPTCLPHHPLCSHTQAPNCSLPTLGVKQHRQPRIQSDRRRLVFLPLHLHCLRTCEKSFPLDKALLPRECAGTLKTSENTSLSLSAVRLNNIQQHLCCTWSQEPFSFNLYTHSQKLFI